MTFQLKRYRKEINMSYCCDDEAGSIGLYEAIPKTGEVKIIWQGE